MSETKNIIIDKGKSTSLSRTEVLIVLDYLLKESSKTKPAKQVDIIKYGIDKYGVEIRRQRIPDILWDLKCFSDEYENELPFKIHDVSTGDKYKYYATHTLFNDEEIETIINAIRNYKYAAFGENKVLISKFLSLISNKYDKEEFLDSIKRDFQLSIYEKRGPRTKDTIAKIKSSIKNHLLITIDIDNPYAIHSDREFEYKKRIKCYFYKLIKFQNIDYAVYYDIDATAWMSCPLDEIKVIHIDETIEKEKDLLKPSIPKGFKSIEDYFKVHLLPLDSNIVKVCFRLSSKKQTYKQIKESFNKHFNKIMKYRPIASKQGSTEFYEVEFEVQELLFIDWVLSDNFVMNNIFILYPSTLTEALICKIENGLQNLKSSYQNSSFKCSYNIRLFKDEQSYYLKPVCEYTETFYGTYEEVNHRADSLLKKYKLEYKEIKSI